MNNKIFGYARVSSKEQNEERQINAFKDFNIDERDIYVDKQSRKDFNRENYLILKHILRENDLLVIKSIDRLGRNYNMIIEEWKDITKNIKADIVVIDMPLLDTRNNKDLLGTFISDLVLQILSYVAEQERSFIKLRQKEGIENALKKGVKFGRPKIEKPSNYDEVMSKWKDKKIKSKFVNYGALFATFAIIIVTTFYSIYVNNVAHYDVIYGGLANIAILMLLIYIISYIIVLGIAINHNYYEIEMNNKK